MEPGLSVYMRMFWAPWLVLFFTLQMIGRGQLYTFLQGYRNYRTWGTGPQRQAKSFDQIKGMEGAIFFFFNFVLACEYNMRISACSDCSQKQLESAVCGTNGKTYSTECELIQEGCSNVRRQGIATFPDFSLSIKT